jgi:3-deoxy-D-manno-octulosonic-acid transferase
VILGPILHIFFIIRIFRGKEDKIRFRERYGKTNIQRPSGKLLWFNAVSIGEINSAWIIIDKIIEKYECNILITTTTVTSAEIVVNKINRSKFKDKIIHQFFPLDFSFSIKNFLNHWKPNVLVSIESEFWPNLFTIVGKKCPIIILNGKMSKKSFRFWYTHKKLKQEVFNNIKICLTQSRIDYRRFIRLGVQDTRFLTNIKFFVDKCSVDKNLYDHLSAKTKNKKLWLVNCTHRGEEEIIIRVHNELKKKYKNLMTILIIRHPNRFNEVEKLMNDNNILYVNTSSNKEITDDTEFYIYDKFGNLGTFFDLCNIVFIAGSLQKNIGGHTPSEAIRHGCCVITGPYIDNNYSLFRELKDTESCIILEDNTYQTLFRTINYLFENEEVVRKISANASGRGVRDFNTLIDIIDIIALTISV